MFSFAWFIVGFILMIVGFLAVWRTDWFLRNMGDISELFGAVGVPWMSWKMSGVFLLFLGFLLAFGLLQAFLQITVGRLFTFGNL